MRLTNRVSIATVITAISLMCCSGGSSTSSLRSGQFRNANVLLVTIDTLRRDRVSAFGNTAGLTPTIDRLAAVGVRYNHAFSHVPMTLPAHTSIMTGLTPRSHGVHNNTTFRLDPHVTTLAASLKSAAYRTGAFVGAFVLDARFGLNQGFDEYDDRFTHPESATFRFAERRASDVVARAGDWIVSGSPPSTHWFAWVHLFDPHAPYDAPAEYRTNRAPYDAEVAYADAMLGVLLDRLRTAHALDRTLIVVTADHGESLGEHGETTHGLFAYDSTLAIPMIISGSGITPAIVDAPAGHVDVMPTILDLVGVAAPEAQDGRSLARPSGDDRPLYFESLDASLTRGWAPLYGIMQGSWKYIELPEPELYDRRSDPDERHNLIGRDSHGEALQRLLAAQLEKPDRIAPAGRIDRDAASRLRALGYVGSAAAPRGTFTRADDPKQLVALNERFTSALTAFDEGHPEAALAAFELILREREDFVAARTSAATILMSAGRSTDAVRLLRDAPSAQADAPERLAKLGAALRDAGDLAGAAQAFERARRGGDENPDLLNDLAVVYAALGRADDARTMFTESLARSSTTSTTWYNLGLLELQNHRTETAAAALRHAVEYDPAYGQAWQALGAAILERDRPGAIDAWRHAERLMPANYDLLFNLAMVSADSDAPADAAPYLRRFVNEAPRQRYGRDIALARRVLARIERPAR